MSSMETNSDTNNGYNRCRKCMLKKWKVEDKSNNHKPVKLKKKVKMKKKVEVKAKKVITKT